jgi:adenosylcobinamide-GDP ribazoletransferase
MDDMTNPAVIFCVALQFLTISPSILRRPFTARELGLSTGLFPIVGALIGGILYGSSWMLDLVFPEIVRVALLLALWVILTGGLHLDGFLDACDGLLGGYSPESRMEIMRDERVGAFALAGGILLLLLLFGAASSLPAMTPAWLIAPVLGRWGMTLAIVFFPYARSRGLGSDFKAHATWRQALIASLFSVPFAILVGGIAGSVSLFAALVVMLGVSRFTLRKIPGMTGDIYGAINLLIEAAAFLVFSLKIW